MVNYPLENRLTAIETTLKHILALLAPEEPVCAYCDGAIDLEASDEEMQPEYDVEDVRYKSGATDHLTLIFHSACNTSRIQELAEEEEKEEQRLLLARQRAEFLRRTGQAPES
jgi:hypothetical protein